MAVTVIEALQNADYNLRNNGPMAVVLAKGQLHNAVELLLKGYSLYEKVEPLLEKYGSVENVPETAEESDS